MFHTPSDLYSRNIWPLGLDPHGFVLSSPPLIITAEHGRFVVWEERSLYYSIQSFYYWVRWWHFSRPDRTTALRQALEWACTHSDNKDRDLVKDILKENQDRDQQLAAIDELLDHG